MGHPRHAAHTDRCPGGLRALWLIIWALPALLVGCVPVGAAQDNRQTAGAGSAATVSAATATRPHRQQDEPAAPFVVLVFSKTAGFRHDSIPDGILAIEELGRLHGFRTEASEDAAIFNDADLARYRAVIFLSTTGDILDSQQQAAFERYIQGGGGFVGVHAASDTEYAWPWYGALVGSYFASHPHIQPATLIVSDTQHPSTQPLPAEWPRTDEWYNFRAALSPAVEILVRIDESSYSGGTMGELHPISWYHRYDGGRAWYTALGHTRESYSEPLFRAHLLGGIRWAAGIVAESGGT